MESDRESILKKRYMKIFALSIVLLIAAFLIMSVAYMLYTFAEPKTSGELEAINRWMNTLSMVSTLSIQCGMVFFSLSILIGALKDNRLPEGIRKAMVLTSGLGILALGIMSVTVIVF
jgi:hypothetical protein